MTELTRSTYSTIHMQAMAQPGMQAYPQPMMAPNGMMVPLSPLDPTEPLTPSEMFERNMIA